MRNGASLFFSSMEPAIFWHWQHCRQCFLQLSYPLQVCDVHQTNLENPAAKSCKYMKMHNIKVAQKPFFWVLSCKCVTFSNQFLAFKRHETKKKQGNFLRLDGDCFWFSLRWSRKQWAVSTPTPVVEKMLMSLLCQHIRLKFLWENHGWWMMI